jgi:hypothetical protein
LSTSLIWDLKNGEGGKKFTWQTDDEGPSKWGVGQSFIHLSF